MKVQKTNGTINFKSGLTFNILKDIRTINIQKSVEDFAKIGVAADFKGKKSVCANFVYATNILYDISEKYKLPFEFTPYAIRVYKNSELVKPGEFFAFSINDTGKILKNEPSFIGGSVFVNDYGSGTTENDLITTTDYLLGRRSSPHFLSNTLHEWFHTIHMDIVYKKLGYGGKCPILSKEYNKKGLNNGLEEYEKSDKVDFSSLPDSFRKYIGKYAICSNSMLEMFAELMTKITTKSLDSNLNVVKNPLDNLPKDMPKMIKNELEELLNI